MSWQDGVLIDGHNTVLYAQAAGTAGAPTTSDEVPFGTAFSWSHEKSTESRGPFINSSTIRKTAGGVERSGELTVDMAAATNTVRALLIAAGNGTSRIKFTLRIGGTNGDTYVWDQALLNLSGEVDPAAGVSLTFSWEADSGTYTAGTYA